MRDFSKYLKDGRRVAAFGEQIDNEVEIFLLYCSKKDQFNKKLAKNVYSYYRNGVFGIDELITTYEIAKNEDGEEYVKFNYAHPVIFRIPIKEGDSAEYTFKMYMKDNFYRLKTINTRVISVADYLVSNGECIKHRIRYAAEKLSS